MRTSKRLGQFKRVKKMPRYRKNIDDLLEPIPPASPGKHNARDSPLSGSALALPFRARGVLVGQDRDLIGNRALAAGAVVGGDNEVIGGSALGQGHGGGGDVTQVGCRSEER